MPSVLIMGNNPYTAADLSRKLSAYNDIGSVRAAACVGQAEAMIAQDAPGVLIIESGGRADWLEPLAGLWARKAMRVILIAENMTDETISKAVKFGVMYCMVKPISAALLHDRVNMVASAAVRTAAIARAPAREEPSLPDRLLDGFGIKANCVGFRYLRFSIVISAKRRANERLMLTKDVYPRIAREYATSRACAERAMRSCINAAWENRHKGNSKMTIFRERPCNGLFIATLTRMLSYGEDDAG